MNNRSKPTDLDLTDDEIEALALKHIAPGYERLRAVVPASAPYQDSEQFRRVKALLADALHRPRAPVADERIAFETWALAEGFQPEELRICEKDGDYISVFTNESWNAWKARATLASAPVAGEPFMYGIMGPDGKAHLDEFCVSADPAELEQEVVAIMNKDHKGGKYSVVALFTNAAPQASAENVRNVDAAMAAEYQQWIDWYHKGLDYDSFLKECVFNKPQADKDGEACAKGDGNV
ncbi:hypothetical protein [Achromobacter xylosoxidans]|uniref:hypothetical protein n=1 Tax=Alcaligenes xylosoxydans xylosoxydans TaxID=85698 RepID=UPI0024483725|nr:hypothetical protein [Achromobacter xylosoxidans]MDH0520606.1 hypothetical protein [Achromobacter xylosoxidans]MDH0547359.1 hypothetical protein [Achromobacter xylosoxidans]